MPQIQEPDHTLAAGTARCSILFVEDDSDMARLVTRALKASPAASFEVTHVESLAAARRLAGERRYDALLLDLSLPDTADGLATLACARALPSDLPIVVLTADDDVSVAVRALEAGVQDFLIKQHQDGASIARALLFSAERHRRRHALVAVATPPRS